MIDSLITSTGDAERSIRRLQWFTIIWMTVEAAVAIAAAIRAHSIALAAFGGDSAIELSSATIVLRRFGSTHRMSEKLASRFTVWLLVLLAAYIAVDSLYTLIAAESKPQPSYVGIGLLCAAAVVMPWLARRKRALGASTNSSSLLADAAQSSICAYLSWIALAGLVLNAVVHASWADPVAALGLLPIVIREAKESFHGLSCRCS